MLCIPRVAEPVSLNKHVRLGVDPECGHVPHNLCPQREGLQHKGVLRAVAVRQLSARAVERILISLVDTRGHKLPL
jgi:hypothetical protein